MYKNIQSLSIWPEKTFIGFILSAINQPLATSLHNAKTPLDGSNGCSANWLLSHFGVCFSFGLVHLILLCAIYFGSIKIPEKPVSALGSAPTMTWYRQRLLCGRSQFDSMI
jgi:hypothetical protein